MSFCIDSIRKDFPILAKEINGKPLVFFDNAASAQKPLAMLEAMQEIYLENYANVHRGIYTLSNNATSLYEQARATVANFIKAPKTEEIIFTKNATEAINLVAYSWAMHNLKAGDEIVLSILEHHSNLVPWHFLRERLGVKLIFVPLDSNNTISAEQFNSYITSKTKLISITHMSNVLGLVLPVAEIIKQANLLNIPILIDGSQAILHQPIDVATLNCDWYIFTGHKLYGPTGVGVLYAKSSRMDEMQPFLGGGSMVDVVKDESITYQSFFHKFEAGTPPFVEAIGLAAAIKYLQNLGLESIYLHLHSLDNYFKTQIDKVKDLKIIGNLAAGRGIFSFQLANIHAYDLTLFLDGYGIAVRAGTHCAQPLLAALNLQSVCRLSFGLYNTIDEIDFFINILQKAGQFFNGRG